MRQAIAGPRSGQAAVVPLLLGFDHGLSADALAAAGTLQPLLSHYDLVTPLANLCAALLMKRQGAGKQFV